jgi:hypothetical protein
MSQVEVTAITARGAELFGRRLTEGVTTAVRVQATSEQQVNQVYTSQVKKAYR